eukprot:TRINITY_DN13050_c0_g1_i1.p1 TRINITY_DN13050_c0_g1~~TRINITY_DN13050_c0_g1_i1.p1  ORF type:complete len:375 (-),score=69.75 TRINITY_DN13050_c0_g1_i1:7-1131(-)
MWRRWLRVREVKMNEGESHVSYDSLLDDILLFIQFIKEQDFSLLQQVIDSGCFIWDVSVKKDACSFLLKQHFVPVLLQMTLLENPRLIEISLGILGNMVLYPEIALEVDKMLVGEMIELYLQSDDSSVLTQVMRILVGFVSSDELKQKWIGFLESHSLLQRILFILGSTTDDVLCSNTCDLVSKIMFQSRTIFDLYINEIDIITLIIEVVTAKLDPKYQSINHTDEVVYKLITIVELISYYEWTWEYLKSRSDLKKLLISVIKKRDLKSETIGSVCEILKVIQSIDNESLLTDAIFISVLFTELSVVKEEERLSILSLLEEIFKRTENEPNPMSIQIITNNVPILLENTNREELSSFLSSLNAYLSRTGSSTQF